MTLKGVANAQGQVEGRRFDETFEVLHSCEFPVGHHVPNCIAFSNWDFFQLLVLKVDHFSKTKEFRPKPANVDSEGLHAHLLDIEEGAGRLCPHHNAAASGEVDWKGDLSAADQGHNLVSNG